MTQIERMLLKKILEGGKGITSNGPSYDENLQQTSPGDCPDLHEDPRYRLGWERCWANLVLALTDAFLSEKTPKDLKKMLYQ